MFGPIRTLVLAAALFLPLAFFVWFAFAQTVVLPVMYLAKFVLLNGVPDVFVDVERNRFAFDWITTLPVSAEALAKAGGQKIATVMTTNPMIYGYGLPVVAGLSLATPISVSKRFIQVLIGAVVILLVQTNGVVWEALKHLAYESGPLGLQHALDVGLTQPVIGFFYQLGYLILPPLTPVALWALMNRRFIQNLIEADSIDVLDQP